MPELLIFLGMAVATYLTRVTMIAALGARRTGAGSSLLRRWLRYVPPAVLAALVTPPILAPEGVLAVGPALWSAIVGMILAWRTRSAFWTILGGLSTFWVLRALGAQ